MFTGTALGFILPVRFSTFLSVPPYFYSPVPPYFLFTGTVLFYIHLYYLLFTGTALSYFHRYQFNLYLPEPFFIHWYSFNLYSPVSFFVHRYRFILYPLVFFFIHWYLNFYSFGPGRIWFTGPVLIIGSILFTGPAFSGSGLTGYTGPVVLYTTVPTQSEFTGPIY